MGKIAITLSIVSLNISDAVSICESPVRLLFDLLHGMKRMDVPLLMVIQFMVLLGYDGQLEMGNSEMENELFMSAVDQLKERLKIRGYYISVFYVIIESLTESKYDKARKCTHLDLCKNLG